MQKSRQLSYKARSSTPIQGQKNLTAYMGGSSLARGKRLITNTSRTARRGVIRNANTNANTNSTSHDNGYANTIQEVEAEEEEEEHHNNEDDGVYVVDRNQGGEEEQEEQQEEEEASGDESNSDDEDNGDGEESDDNNVASTSDLNLSMQTSSSRELFQEDDESTIEGNVKGGGYKGSDDNASCSSPFPLKVAQCSLMSTGSVSVQEEASDTDGSLSSENEEDEDSDFDRDYTTNVKGEGEGGEEIVEDEEEGKGKGNGEEEGATSLVVMEDDSQDADGGEKVGLVIEDSSSDMEEEEKKEEEMVKSQGRKKKGPKGTSPKISAKSKLAKKKNNSKAEGKREKSSANSKKFTSTSTPTPSSWWCSHTSNYQTLTSPEPHAPFKRKHGFAVQKVDADGDCFYNCILCCLGGDEEYKKEMEKQWGEEEKDSAGKVERGDGEVFNEGDYEVDSKFSVRFMRELVASKLTETQLEFYKLQELANPEERWLDFLREPQGGDGGGCVTGGGGGGHGSRRRGQIEVEIDDVDDEDFEEERHQTNDDDNDDSASSKNFELMSMLRPEMKDVAPTRRTQRKSSMKNTLTFPPSRPVRTLSELRSYVRRTGYDYGHSSCLWADSFAFEVIATYFRIDILFVDVDRRTGENPYRVLARGGKGMEGKGGVKRSIRYVVLIREREGHFNALVYRDSDGNAGKKGKKGKKQREKPSQKPKVRGSFTLKDGEEPDAISKLWGVGEVGVDGNEGDHGGGIWWRGEGRDQDAPYDKQKNGDDDEEEEEEEEEEGGEEMDDEDEEETLVVLEPEEDAPKKASKKSKNRFWLEADLQALEEGFQKHKDGKNQTETMEAVKNDKAFRKFFKERNVQAMTQKFRSIMKERNREKQEGDGPQKSSSPPSSPPTSSSSGKRKDQSKNQKPQKKRKKKCREVL